MLIVYIALPLITLGLCVWATPIGRAAGIVDAPDGVRKTHSKPTPLVGGIAVLIPLAIMAAVLTLTTDYSPFYLVLGIVMAAFLVLGFVDDQRHIPPVLRLGLSVALVVVALMAVPGFTVTFFKFSFLTSPVFFGGLSGALFTILCVVGLQNAVNMADGKNGVVIGISLIWVALLALYAPGHLQPLLAVFGAGLAITLAFNLRGKLFLGDSGTYGISAAIALIAIYTHNVAFTTFPADARRADVPHPGCRCASPYGSEGAATPVPVPVRPQSPAPRVVGVSAGAAGARGPSSTRWRSESVSVFEPRRDNSVGGSSADRLQRHSWRAQICVGRGIATRVPEVRRRYSSRCRSSPCSFTLTCRPSKLSRIITRS